MDIEQSIPLPSVDDEDVSGCTEEVCAPHVSYMKHDLSSFLCNNILIWRNLALHYLLTNGCIEVNGCRQNKCPNISIIHK